MENNSHEEIQQSPPVTKLPFNNLFLNAGFVDGQNKFWMYVMGITATIGGYFLMQFVTILPLVARAIDKGVTTTELINNQHIIFDSNRLEIDKNWILLAQFGLFVGAFAMFYMVIKYIHRKQFLSVVTGYDKFRYKHFFFAFGIWAAILIFTVLVTYFTSSTNDLVVQFDLPRFLVLFFICIIFLPIQTLCEEVIFRSYLIQGFSQVCKNGIMPVVITSVMFGLAHMSNPETRAFGMGIMLSYYIIFAFFLGAITLLNEGLELAFGIHLANNFISALTVTSQTAVLKTDAIFYAKSEDAGAELVIAFCAIIVVFVVFWFKFKWKNFSLLIK
ncbi:MAG: CPBP family intramembrane glutamic endopeptidase [Bacteroidota bacterium]|nr:CPBP family intramembrane glutamic endopeptidase [Bacteroidota bacterium]